jgi:thiosulfate/3-mercaptopyruvate sulfurtransferase
MTSLARHAFATSVVVLSVTAAGASPRGAQQSRDTPLLVTPAWVAEHLPQGKVVLFQIGDEDEYKAAHIPGARFIRTRDVSDPEAKLRLQMAGIDRLRRTFESFGVSDDSQVVLYWGNDWATPTARIFVALDYLGLGGRTSIMDGGLPAWRAANRPVTTDSVEPVPGHLTPHPRPEVIVDAAWIEARLKDPAVTILDARDAVFYSGESDGRGSIPRPGHIAGARSIPFSSLVVEPPLKMKDVAALRALFEAAGVEPGGEVVTYCHIGQQASLLYFAAEMLGYRVHLYDGSYEDWAANPALPVEKGAGKR